MKALILPVGCANYAGGALRLEFDMFLTSDSGVLVAGPQGVMGSQRTIPRQNVAFGGSATTLINDIEAKAIAAAASVGQTIVAADIVIGSFVQGA
jgi:hypothetical protein